MSNGAGIQIETPGGPAWTDYKGQAALPNLPAFLEFRVEIAGETLPRNVEVVTGIQTLKVARGAVTSVKLELNHVRRALLRVRMADGSVSAPKIPIVDEEQTCIGMSSANGSVSCRMLEAASCLPSCLMVAIVCWISHYPTLHRKVYMKMRKQFVNRNRFRLPYEMFFYA